jgi:hypothetical protein
MLKLRRRQRVPASLWIRTLNLLVSIAFAALSAPAVACNIPVFRYALERWRADSYEAVLFYRGRLR